MNLKNKDRIRKHLELIYDDRFKLSMVDDVVTLIEEWRELIPQFDRDKNFSGSVLITYPDQITQKGHNPLQSMSNFIKDKLGGAFSIVHVLPFYPWTSDDGFSVKDYFQVQENYGSWNDFGRYPVPIMGDAVFNHISSRSEWFKKALAGNREFINYFISYPQKEVEEKGFSEKVDKVIRPRTHDLLTPYDINGREKRYFWTTFSEDQIDTNFANFEFLKCSIEILLLYMKNNMAWVRIDAVPFFWKELGTTCSHHPKTHEIVKLYRTIMDELDKGAILVTESNVPHEENVSYFGNGRDEAHMVYNFTLPGLLLHALESGSAKELNQWSSQLKLPEEGVFFNITATHDGIGMRGIEGILSPEEKDRLCQRCSENGGKINYKSLGGDRKTAYELNITWRSMVEKRDLPDDQNIKRIVNSQAIVLAYPGVPAFYFQGLLGTENWNDGVVSSGMNRRINRQKYSRYEIDEILSFKKVSSHVFEEIIRLCHIKRDEKAFDVKAAKEDFHLHDQCWSFLRKCPKSGEKILVLISFSGQKVKLDIPQDFQEGKDLISGRTQFGPHIFIDPFQMIWLKA